jgi:hypothetical protein
MSNKATALCAEGDIVMIKFLKSATMSHAPLDWERISNKEEFQRISTNVVGKTFPYI